VRILFVVAVLAISTGCGDLLSLHPIYTAQDQKFDPVVEGRWESDDDVLIVKRASNAYEFTIQGKRFGKVAAREYEAHLVDIGGVRFVDMIPTQSLGHMFAKLRVSGGKMTINFLDSKWLIEKIPHEMSEVAKNETMPVVTMKTEALRMVVTQYAAEAKAYDKDMVFTKK